MKTKPHRHKEFNTFRFKTFSERVAVINVDIFHRVCHRNEVDTEEVLTYFHQAIEKWNLLNLAESYEALRKELPMVHTLPQLLNKKDEVVAVLVKYLHIDNALALQPTLQLVVALARDLRQEFYPYYYEILQYLVKLLETKDPDQLEWTFSCLAYLFKFLWRCLVKDVRIVFDSLLPLLAHKKPYINNFAAESFAFVVRKVKDKKSFLSLVLRTLRKRLLQAEESSTPLKSWRVGEEGCGVLLFEVIRGVKGQFHSCTDEVLPMYFNALADKSIPQDLLFNVLTSVLDALFKSINPINSTPLWTALLSSLESFTSSWQTDPTEKNAKTVELALQLLNQAVTFKDARLLTDPVTVIKQITVMLKLTDFPESVIYVASEISGKLLMSPSTALPQELANNVMVKMLAVPYSNTLVSFVEQVFDYSGFESFVLPQVLRHCSKKALKKIPDEVLCLFTKLVIHKAQPCDTGIDLDHWHRYPLTFPNANISNAILKTLSVSKVQSLVDNVEAVLCSLIVLPHLSPLDHSVAASKLKKIIVSLCKHMKNRPISEGPCKESSEAIEVTNKVVFLLVHAIEAVVHVTDPRTLLALCDFDLIVDSLLLPAAAGSNQLGCLRALDIFSTAVDVGSFSEEASAAVLAKLYGCLAQNLSSPFHKVRLLTAHLFTQFEPAGQGVGTKSVFSLCLAAEQVPNTITEYRDKLNYLRSLEFGVSTLALANAANYNKVPLQYILGVLYVNLNLLWEPVTKILASFAVGMPEDDFWEVFLGQLHRAAENVVSNGEQTAPTITLAGGCNFLYDLHETSMCNSLDRTDHVNYRILLWKAMLQFQEVCSRKTKDITPLILTFIDREYYKMDAHEAPTWNIKLYDKGDADQTLDQSIIMNNSEIEADQSMEVDQSIVEMEPNTTADLDSDGEANLDPEVDTKTEVDPDTELTAVRKKLSERPAKIKHRPGLGVNRSLAAHLGIFPRMKDPSSVYREEELRKIYNDLLYSKSPEVQKVALDCLMSYKYPYMVPYREQLYGLIENKSMKSTLAMFRVDKESELLLPSHRGKLMPIVLRIVYSKMMSKAPHKGGKGIDASHLRKAIILRFLAGCLEEELMTFVKLAFRIYEKYMEGDILVMVETIMTNIDLENVIPPRRLNSTMQLLAIMLYQFGGLMGDQLRDYLLRVLLAVAANVVGMFKQREMIHVGYVALMRSVRTQCFTTVGKFFDRLTRFEWAPSTLDAVFSTLVFPNLYKLDNEGFQCPTPILRLFVIWSKHSRYFPLLAKHPPGDPSMTPVSQMMRLLIHDNVHQSVVSVIMEIVERLLTWADFNPLESEEEGEEQQPPVAPMPTNNVVPVDKVAIAKLGLKEEINYGSAILLGHIPTILAQLKRKLVTKNKALNSRELLILSRVSELVWESETSDTLLRLMLPLLVKKSTAGEDVVVPLITTLANLVKNLDEPGKYVRNLAPLFGEVCGAGPRRMLSLMMEEVAKRCDPVASGVLSRNLVVIAELNAWDRKRIDQPDFGRRLDGFKTVNTMVDAKDIDFDLGLIVMHTCFHYLKVETDLSLRDSASYCVRRLAPALCNQYIEDKILKELLVKTILNLVCQGIRSKVDAVFNEAIGLLGAMARECPDANVVFKDLSVLTNKEDLEVDFFENLQHLQGHRKARAMSKFCQKARKFEKAPNNATLVKFILPISTRFLMNENFQKKHVTVDAAIETVGVVCRLIQWNQYDLILRFYLEKLKTLVQYQKQLTRVIIAILDAFHFDLSRSNEVAEVMKAIELSEPQIAVTNEVVLDESLAEGEVLEKSGVDEQEGLLSQLETVEADEVEMDQSVKEVIIPAMERVALLTPAMAVKARDAITRELLPQLHTCIAQRSHSDMKHKVNRRRDGDFRDEEDVLRIPIALAAVKLLQQLPKQILERNLPGIFMKLCSYLKSRLDSVRRVTRQTLMKIMRSLGPDYLSHLISEMCGLLTRGFQVHVLVYTIHALVVELKDLFRPGDADACLKDVLECCRMDVFGPSSEEKKVAGIVNKVAEAKATKGFDTYQVMAQFITEKCLTDLLIPLQQVLVRSTSAKCVEKCTECLRNVIIGLTMNKFITPESLLIFTYGTVSESIPELSGPKSVAITDEKREHMARQRPDTFLIPQAPRTRYGAMTVQARTTASTNAHILVEFGLKLLNTLIRREAIRNGDYQRFVDPMVPIVVTCLDAKHIKLSTLGLVCLRQMLKMELPSLKKDIENVVSQLFALLHRFAAAGLSMGDNFDLVAAAFKTVIVLVRDVRWHTISKDQLKALLLYVEQDMHNMIRQAMAFSLLRTILGRKLIVPEIYDVMQKVAEMSIVSESAFIRQQGRQVFHQFLMDYPLGKKLKEHVEFFVCQLDFELQSGRESALETLHKLITAFPDELLSQHCGLLFISIGARLVNDEVPQCRKMVAVTLQAMLARLNNDDREKLFSIAETWLTDKLVNHRKLAAQLCGIFVLVEKAEFENRLVGLLPNVISQFGRGYDDSRPGKFVRTTNACATVDDDLQDTEDSRERLSDHHLFQVLQLTLKMSEHCPRFFTGRAWQEYVTIIAENAQALLAHAHEWVRLAAAQFLGHLFASLDPVVVAKAAYTETDDRGFLRHNTAPKLKSLVLDLCAQLHTTVAPELAAQVVKNLVFLGRVLKAIKILPASWKENTEKVQNVAQEELEEVQDVAQEELDKVRDVAQEEQDEVQDQVRMEDDTNSKEVKEMQTTELSLYWIIWQMRGLVNRELVKSSASTILRTSVFQWIGAIVIDSKRTEIIPVLYHLLAPIAHEILCDHCNPELLKLATDVSKILKSKFGVEEYTRQLAVVERKVMIRRAERKRERAREAVTDPERYAKRKIEKQLKKKDAKRRKIDVLKGRKPTTKKKVRV